MRLEVDSLLLVERLGPGLVGRWGTVEDEETDGEDGESSRECPKMVKSISQSLKVAKES